MIQVGDIFWIMLALMTAMSSSSFAEDRKADFLDATFTQKLKTSFSSTRNNPEDYLDMVFLISYFLRHPEHGYSPMPKEQATTAAELIGNMGIALKEGIALEEVLNEACYTTGVLGFSADSNLRVIDRENKVALKYGVQPYQQYSTKDVSKQLTQILQQLRLMFFRIHKDYHNKFNSTLISREQTQIVVQYMTLAFDQVKLILENKTSPEEALKLLCESVKTLKASGGTSPSGLQLIKLYLQRQAASSAYLVAPFHAVVFSYMTMSVWN